MSAKFWLASLGLLIVTGCAFPVRQQVDSLICDRSNQGFDLSTSKEESTDTQVNPLKKPEEPLKKPNIVDRLAVPPTITGANIKDIIIPSAKDKEEFKDQIAPVIKEYFPPLAKVAADPDFPPGPEGRPLSLSDLQKIAFTNSPLLRQSASDIEAARGAAIQAGAYPNPTLNYQGTGVGPNGGPTYGMSVSQLIKTGGKLKLAQAAALMDLQNAEIAYHRAEQDLMYSVRTNYYGVVVAQESIRINRGLVELTDEVYRVMVDQLRNGYIAAYEPLQLKVFSEQARMALIQARNSRLLAWRQLAAALGVPHMPATAVVGRANRGVPRLDFEKALAHVLTEHTDVLTTKAVIEKARYLLRLAQVTPIPDVTVQAGVFVDSTAPGPYRLFSTLQVGVPVPIFDQNKGGIRQSQAALVRAIEEPHRVQADLTARFSEAYRRYEESRLLLEMYHANALPKQVLAFRATVKRYFGSPVGIDATAPAFSDLIASEQNLVTLIGNYIPVLQAQWQAVVDVSSFLQTDQLFKMADEVSDLPGANFEDLLKLPCNHPCSPPVPTPTPESFGAPPVAGPLSRLEAPTAPRAAPRAAAAFLRPAALTAPAAAYPGSNLVNEPSPPAQNAVPAASAKILSVRGQN